MDASNNADQAGAGAPENSEARINRHSDSGLKIKKHKPRNDSDQSKNDKSIDSRTAVINKAKGQKIGLPFHTTPPELIVALTSIRDATPGCSARTQEDRLEKALHRWPLTSFEMLKWLGLYDPRARIQGLRLKGLVINRVWVLIETDCGQVHRVGRYAIQRGLTVPVVFPSQSDLFRETTCAAAGPAAVDGREVVV